MLLPMLFVAFAAADTPRCYAIDYDTLPLAETLRRHDAAADAAITRR